MWSSDKFDPIVHKAFRCDRSFRRPHSPSYDIAHVQRVLTRLMLHGNVKAAIQWLPECSKGSDLLHDNTVSAKIDGIEKTLSVIEALKLKHPQSHRPHSISLSDSPIT